MNASLKVTRTGSKLTPMRVYYFRCYWSFDVLRNCRLISVHGGGKLKDFLICQMVILCIVTQRRSVAKNVGCFRRRLFVCLFVCQHDSFRMIKHRMKLRGSSVDIQQWASGRYRWGRCIEQKSPPSSNLGAIAPMQYCVDSNHISHCNLSDHSIIFARWRHTPSLLAQPAVTCALQRVACR